MNNTTGNVCSVAESFEWSHFRILLTESKVRTALSVQHNKTAPQEMFVQ